MSKLYNGGASFGFSLNYNTAVPVDTRLVVSTLADLKNPETWVSGTFDSENDANNVYTVYPGLTVTVTSEKTVYIFVAETVNGETLAADSSWSKLSTSEATGDTQAAINTVKESVGLGENGEHVQTSGNYTSEATTVTGEIAAIDSVLKETKDEIGTSTDTKDSSTVYGNIAKVQDNLDTEKSKFEASSTITVGENSYETALEIVYVAATGDVAAHIALCDKNGYELSTVGIDNIVGNGTLKSSSYNKETGILTLTWNKADGKTTTTPIDLSAMLDINDVLVDSTSANYLSVDLTGGENSQAVFKALIKDIATSTAESTGLADANDVKTFVETSIQALDKVATTTDGVNVHVTISEEDGIVSVDSVTEDYATVTRVASEGETKASLSVSDESGLVTGADIVKVAAYTDDKISEEASRVDSKIASLSGSATGSDGDEVSGSKVTVKVDTAGGEVSNVTVTTNDIASKAELDALDTYVKGEKVTAGDGSVTGGIEKRVAVLEEYTSSQDFESTVDKSDASGNVQVVIKEAADGKLDPENSSVSVKYSSYTSETEAVTDGLATGTLVKEVATDLIQKAVDNLDIDAALSDSDDASHVTVSINQENGKIKDLQVTSSDIASAALLGTLADTSSQETAFGKIAEEKEARIQAIQNLDAEVTSEDHVNVSVKVTEEDGKVTAVNVNEKYATVTRVTHEENVDASFIVEAENKEGLVKGSDLEKVAAYADDIVSVERTARENAIASLDSSFDVKDSKEYVRVATEIEDGKIKAGSSSVNVTYGDYFTDPTTTNGIATVEDTKTYVGSVAANLEVSASGDSYVSATRDEVNNKKIVVTSNVVTMENATEVNTGLADSYNVKLYVAEAKKAVEDQLEWVEID